MVGLKGCLTILIGYVIAVCALFSSKGRNPSLTDWEKLKDQTISKIDNFGLTGHSLLELFQDNLAVLSFSDGQYHHKHVSLYYDTFKEYILRSASSKNCVPVNSAIAKLNRDVNPMPVHSHNDYWRKLPLFEGLAHGARSTEADVWNIDGKVLAVGHNEAYLDPIELTLDKLYTGPLLEILEEVNCQDSGSDRKNGVYFNSPETSLFFYIDFKSDDRELTYKLLIEKYFKPLIDSGYLTYYDMKKDEIVWNPVTVILTGNYPTSLDVLDNGNDDGYFKSNQRFAFLDAPLLNLEQKFSILSVATTVSFNQLMKHCGSDFLKVALRGHMDSDEISCAKKFIDEAHELKLITRIWGAPTWPANTVKAISHQIVHDLGSDLLNLDDLFMASTLI
ncbi:YDL237W [Saccharomyces arboricola H-6]|uniref:Altered inheritance of mitochondria protein 6 n=1 Tax=Saccharomyces arboricola (strain H-6 / AS 2.3317 / CBS 10644) TaxID=1160507 RepID=J8QA40_SACAR|nr:YDL237W [Saccharomyces arboricola H-6]